MKLKYTIIFLIMIISLNGVFACTVTTSNFSQISCSACDVETKICNCNFIGDIETTSAIINGYQTDSCEDYTINFYTNGNDLKINHNFNFSNTNNIANLIINGFSDISIYQDAKIIFLPNIIVEGNKKLDIKTADYLQATEKDHNLTIESILVKQNGTLNIDVKSNDGVSATSAPIYNNRGQLIPIVSNGTASGNLNLNINYLANYGNLDINLKTGNGGNGLTKEGDEGWLSADDDPNSGGNGENSGDLNVNIKDIENFKDFIINLKTGNGGSGGNTAVDDCSGAYVDEDFDGGNAGSAGNINIKSIDQINNQGNFYITAIAGDGGVGGSQRGCCDNGTNGNGGNGGSIFDLNISRLLNKKSDGTNPNPKFKVDIKNGALGKIVLDDCAGETSDLLGKPGGLGNINIDFLENDSPDKLEIISAFNFTTEEYQLAVTSTNNDGDDEAANSGNMRQLPDLNLKLSEIKINYLKNGSYLPKNISASIPIDNDEYFNNDIRIDGCYINPTAVNYNIKDDTIIGATNPDAISVVNPNFDLTYRFCPHCEIMPLDDTQNRYTRDYSLYSNTNGIVNIGDLNIHYSNPLDQSIYYTKRTDDKQLPVYTNKNPISGEWNPKINSYEYKIKPEDLNYYSHTPEEDIDLLNQEDNLFCYGQEYIINGKINAGAIKPFNFPFVPLRELFTE